MPTGQRPTENPTTKLLRLARLRAAKQGFTFSLTARDIEPFPDRCPALGIPLFRGRGRVGDNSPTIDRIVPHLGYEPGNVIVISSLANRIKSNATWRQIETVAAWLKGVVDK